jgi:hypothetical protein
MLQKSFQVFFLKISFHKVVNVGGMVGQELSSVVHLGLISPTFSKQIFCTKDFSLLRVGFEQTFLQKMRA